MKSLFTFLFLILLDSIILFAQWIPSNGPSTGYIREFAYKGSDIYASNFYSSVSGIYISRDDGVNWELADFDYFVNYLLISDSNMYCIGDGKLCHSTDDGLSWTILKNDFYSFNDIAVKDSNIYIASSSLMHSTNFGKTWSYYNNWISSLLITESKIFAGSSGKILSSTDNGLNWQHHPLADRGVSSLAANENNIFAGTDSGLYISNDDGITWTPSPLKDVMITSLAAKDSNIFVGSIGALHISSDNGQNWKTVIFSDSARNPEFPTQILTISPRNSSILVGTNNGIYRSTDDGDTWTIRGVKAAVSLLNIKDSTFFASAENGFYVSTDFGQTWPLSYNYSFFSMTNNKTHLFGGSDGVYYSSDNGKTWNSTALNNRTILSLSAKDSLILAGTNNYGVYRSSNNGAEWTETSLKIFDIRALIIIDSVCLAGPMNSGVYRSTDAGKTWFRTSKRDGCPSSMVYNNKKILAGFQFIDYDATGVYISADKGLTWENTSVTGDIYSFAVIDSIVFACGMKGVFYSSDWGKNWTLKNEGFIYDDFTAPSITSLVIFKDYIYASNYMGIWKRPLSEFTSEPTSIKTEIKVPIEFFLSQNYPNPFNPGTTINYSIPEPGFVTIKVFDNLGREISTLVNEEKESGNYEVKFNADNLASGVYLYQLITGSYIQCKKMILMK